MRQAIVIGTGIGGLSAGLALEQAGFEVNIYERTPELGMVGAGISLWANAIKALDQLGVGTQVRSLGVTDGQGGFHTPSGKTLAKNDTRAMEQHFGAPTVIIHRADLSQILRDKFTGALHLGKRFTGYTQEGERIRAAFEDGTHADADLLVCADGIHSVLRQTWFPESKPIYAGYTAWRGVATFDHGRVGGHWGETLGRGQRFGLAPLSDGRLYWFATQNQPVNQMMPTADRQAALLKLFGSWYDPIADVIRATPTEQILQNDIYDIQPLTEWVRGRALLLGDSAHAMTPNMGQGGCQAIEDALVLGKCLRESLSIEAGLEAYQSQRVAHANKVLMMSRRIGQAMTIANPVVCAIRNFVLRITPPSAQLRNLQGIVGHEI